MMNMKYLFRFAWIALIALAGTFGGCDSIFGTKGDRTTDEIFEEGKIDPNLVPDEIGYAALLPFWDFFDAPTDVFIGYDELVYVTDRSGLHLLDRAGRVYYETIELDGAVAVTQDRDLNVYVAARYDTVILAADPGIDSWGINLDDDSSVEVTTNPQNHDNSRVLRIDIGPYFADRNYELINYGEDFELLVMEQGVEYELSFRALTQNDEMTVSISLDNGPPDFSSYFEDEVTVSQNGWQDFSFSFNNDMNENFADTTKGRIVFDLAFEANESKTIFLDDVKMRRTDNGDQPINFNGNFEKSSLGDTRPLVWNLPAVFKFRDINKGSPVVIDTIIHPFDDISRPTASAQRGRLVKDSPNNHELVEFTDVTTLHDNTLYITRRGPQNITGRGIAADNIVMEFQQDPDRGPGKMRNNRLLRALSPNTPSLMSAVGPSAITGLAGPPQRETITQDRSFIIAQASSDASIPFRVLWINAELTPDGLQFSPRSELLARDTTEADKFLYDQFRFTDPSGLAFSADDRNHIFVTDAATDSLYLFQARGVEGVNPPPGSQFTKAQSVSFGGTGGGDRQFRNPSGVAYFNRIVYVADTGNNRITRHRLNTDFERN